MNKKKEDYTKVLKTLQALLDDWNFNLKYENKLNHSYDKLIQDGIKIKVALGILNELKYTSRIFDDRINICTATTTE